MSEQDIITKVNKGTHIIVPKWLALVRNVITPTALIMGIFYIGGWKTDIENKTFKDAAEKNKVIEFVTKGNGISEKEKTEFEAHTKDLNIHMPLKEKLIMFVPRTELEATLNTMNNNIQFQNEMLKRIEKKLDR